MQANPPLAGKSYSPHQVLRPSTRRGPQDDGMRMGRSSSNRPAVSICRFTYLAGRERIQEEWRPCLSARPGVAPVWSPLSMTTVPLTMTYGIPTGNCLGWVLVVRAFTLSG